MEQMNVHHSQTTVKSSTRCVLEEKAGGPTNGEGTSLSMKEQNVTATRLGNVKRLVEEYLLMPGYLDDNEMAVIGEEARHNLRAAT